MTDNPKPRGRPPATVPVVKVTLMLHEVTVATLKAFRENNMSLAVRVLAEREAARANREKLQLADSPGCRPYSQARREATDRLNQG